jgi:predicted component of type VI protein secretion system
MALTLIVRSGDVSPSPELTFDSPRVVIGRRPNSELWLPDPSVSLRHASLRQRGSEYVVFDEGSENGSFIGNVELTPRAPHPLRDRDLLRFGRVWVEVRLPSTRPISTPTDSAELAGKLVARALELDKRPSAATIQIESGPLGGKTLKLDFGRALLVGPRASSDLVLSDAAGPAPEVEICRRGKELSLLRHGTDGHARLKGRTLKAGERVSWAPDTALELGENVFRHQDPVTFALGQLAQEETERLGPKEVVAPPNGARPDASALLAAKTAAPEDDAAPRPSAPSTSRPAHAWAPADALVLMLALSILGASLWAITWLTHVPSLPS